MRGTRRAKAIVAKESNPSIRLLVRRLFVLDRVTGGGGVDLHIAAMI